ncbi:MAG: MCE family protein [Candidatus Hydrogenedentes bacterium]|nr:MCE family protein [Candidatus Hydrogenedentota bacterium]
MATRTQKTKVGIFLLISAVMIVGGLMLVAGFRQGARLNYLVVFDKTVLGLYKGGMVQYLGVPVGLVDDIYVGDDGKAYVDLVIDPKKVTLREGVEATLEFYSFATGTMCVALKGGDPKGRPLPPGSIIPTGASLMESVSSQAGDLMATFNKIAEKIDAGMKDMPEGRITEIVDQIKPFIDDARAFITDARDTLKTLQTDVHGAIDDARPGIAKFKDLAESATKMSDTANKTIDDLRTKMQPVDLEKVQTKLLALSDQLEQTTKNINGMTTSVPYTLDNVQHALLETTQKLNETLESFRELAETLNQNPYVRGTAAPEE